MTKHSRNTYLWPFSLVLLMAAGLTVNLEAAQYARPDGTLSVGAWTAVGAATLHEAVDEVFPPDGDTTHLLATANTTAELTLNDVTDPQSSVNHILRFSMKTTGGQGPERVEVFLYQGAAQIAATGTQSSRNSYSEFAYTLTATEADSITDYADLRVLVTSSSIANGEEAYVSWVELEVPDAAATVPPTLSSSTVAAVEPTTATLGATIDDDGGDTISQHGVVWNTTGSPTLADNSTTWGPATTGPFSGSVSGLPQATRIFSAGYATNSAGTDYSPEISFYTEPATQASAVTFGTVTGTTMQVSWTVGSGDGTIVLVKQGAAVSANPVDGTEYTSNTIFGGGSQIGAGNYVVHVGAGNSVTVTGLTEETTYHVAVFGYAGTGAGISGINYQQTNPALGNQTTLRPPALSSPTVTAVEPTTATLGATIDDDGGGSISDHGTVWNTTGTPTTGDNPSNLGPTTPGPFTDGRTGLPQATLIYSRGYATNAAGTGYSPELTFYTEPATQASGVTFSNVTPTGMRVSWSGGSGQGSIVLMKQGSAVAADPVDGTEHAANPDFGSGAQIGTGNYVVYRAPGTQVDVTGLTPDTTYHVAVYAYAGSGTGISGINYQQTTPALGNRLTDPLSEPTLSSPTLTAIEPTTATLGATVDSDGGDTISEYGTVWNTTGSPTTADNTNTIAGAPPAIPHTYTHGVTGFTQATQVFYAGYAVNSTGTGYSPEASFYTEPATQPSSLSFPTVNENDLTINWTRGSGTGLIIMMKEASAVSSDPADGTEYTANPAFGSGSQIGAGNYVVYVGTGTSVSVTGLSAGTTYHVALYEYAGAGSGSSGINYQQTSPLTGSQDTSQAATEPAVTSPTVSAVEPTTATLGATVTDDGGDPITEYGTVWNTTGSPTTADNKTAIVSEPPGYPHPFTHGVSGLPAATLIYYGGYATNNIGTGYSIEDSFYTEPAVQPSGLAFSNVTASGVTLNWTPGVGSTGTIILIKQSSAVNANPADGTEYTADSNYPNGTQVGAGNYVVFVGSGNTVSVSGLSSDTTYYFALYAYAGNGSGSSGINYQQTTPVTGSQVTSVGGMTQASRIGVSIPELSAFADRTQMTVTWTPGNGEGSIVLVRQGSAVNASPSDGVEYSPNTVYGNGAEVGTGNFVVFSGAGNSVTVTGLTAGVAYHAAVFTYEGAGTSTDYLMVDPGNPFVEDLPAITGHNAVYDVTDCGTPCHGLHGGTLVPRELGQEAACVTCHNETGEASSKSDVALHEVNGGATIIDCGSCHDVHNNVARILWSEDGHTPGTWLPNQSFMRQNTTKYVSQALEPALLQLIPSHYAFDAGSEPWNGSCQTCHLNTSHHTNDATADHDHRVGENCVGCHAHGGGFAGAGGACTDCHNSVQDDGDSSPPGGRRAVVNEFGYSSHHVQGTVTDADCEVCHEMTQHQNDQVRLFNADNPGTVYVLTGDPATSSTEAAKLTAFCLSCHDSDGAGGVNPFSDNQPSPVIDSAAWSAGSHSSNVGCYGNGAFGCHASGHGSEKKTLLAPFGSPPTAPANTEEEEGFCFNCHDSDGPASTDVSSQFSAPIRWVGAVVGASDNLNINDRHDIQYDAQTTSGAVIECTDCHDPHSASPSSMVWADPDPGDGRVPGTGDVIAGGDFYTEWCLDCHDGSFGPGVTAPTVPLDNVRNSHTSSDAHGIPGGNPLLKSGYGWAAGDLVSCLACHSPHPGAKNNIFQGLDQVMSKDGTTPVPSDSFGTDNYEMTDNSVGVPQVNGFEWCNTCHTGSMGGKKDNCFNCHYHSTRW